MGFFSRLFLVLVLLTVLPDLAQAAGCYQVKPAPTKINVSVELPEPFYNLKQDIKTVNKNRAEINDAWIAKNGMHKVWKSSDMVLLGYAEGEMALYYTARLDIQKYDSYGVYYCLYIKDIDISMMFRTRIVIPNNFKNGGCRFNLVHEHELRHYQTNRDVAQKFTDQLRRDLPVMVREMENRQPYIEGKHVKKVAENLKASLQDSVKAYIIDSMQAELARRNGQIDTPEEYASSGPKMAACAD